MEKIRIKQVKSAIDRPENQKRTIRALGFTKMQQEKDVEGTPQILGMIKKVAHLLKIEQL
ncbi:MAG: 50S ribosomal protein L30 [Bacteroidia bacterium]|nr:50S ribosomal protein L30 [Bacteroidia bacterium]